MPDTDPPGARLAAGQIANQFDKASDMNNKLREWDALWDKISKN